MSENLVTLRNEIIEDHVVSSDEVVRLEQTLYTDGKIDRDEATTLFEINDAVSGNNNAVEWPPFFADAMTDAFLNDEVSPGVVSEEEALFIVERIMKDGQVDDTERLFLKTLRTKATAIAAPLADKMTELGL